MTVSKGNDKSKFAEDILEIIRNENESKAPSNSELKIF